MNLQAKQIVGIRPKSWETMLFFAAEERAGWLEFFDLLSPEAAWKQALKEQMTLEGNRGTCSAGVRPQ